MRKERRSFPILGFIRLKLIRPLLLFLGRFSEDDSLDPVCRNNLLATEIFHFQNHSLSLIKIKSSVFQRGTSSALPRPVNFSRYIWLSESIMRVIGLNRSPRKIKSNNPNMIQKAIIGFGFWIKIGICNWEY